MYDFGNKVVLVSGASRGIGAALARALAEEGANLALISRDGEAVRKMAVELKRVCGVDAIGRQCNISDLRRVEAVFEEIEKRFPTLDLLINNAAALGSIAPVADYSPQTWAATIDSNINGTFYMTHHACMRMRAKKSGRVVFVGSTVAREARAGWGAYAVSKHGLEWLMRLLAAENDESGVCSCSVNPGGTATETRRQAHPDEDPATLPTPEQVAQAFLRILRRPDSQLNGRTFNARDFLEDHAL
jgi:NAD(P)-dependent dehydrogenase (short-subunit alcohol dehydrogenase family)